MFHQVLACDITGRPHDWLSWEDGITLKVKGAIAYEIGDANILARGGISRMTGEQSAVSVAPIICLKGQFKRKDRVALNNHNLFRRDLCICAYCGRHFPEHKLSRDHVTPRSRNGKDVWTNVVTSCKQCNNIKDDCTPEEADMPLIYVPYEPNHSEELVLKNRKILFDQMEYMKSYLPQHSRLHMMHFDLQ